MSGVEKTTNDPAQCSGINVPTVGGEDVRAVQPDDKELCDFVGVRNGSNSCAVGGEEGEHGGEGLTSCDLGKCYGEDLKSVQTVEGALDICDTSFQGGEEPGKGNTFGGDSAAQQPNHGNVCEGKSMVCQLLEDGTKEIHCDEKASDNSLGAIETEVKVPHSDSCHDASTDPEKVLDCGNEMTGGTSLSPREAENKTLAESGVVSWESIYEVAKQSLEIVGDILTAHEQNVLSPERETGEQSGAINGVHCVQSETVITGGIIDSSVKSDALCESLNPEGETFNLQEEVPVGGLKIDESSQIQEDVVPLRVHDEQIEQKEDSTSKIEPDNECKEETYMAEQVRKPQHDIGQHSDEIAKGMSPGVDDKSSLKEHPEQSVQVVGNKNCVVVLGIPATDPTLKPHLPKTPTIANEASEKSRRGRKPGIGSATSSEKTPQQPSASSSRVLRAKLGKNTISPESVPNLENTQGSFVEKRGRKKGEVKGKSADEFSKMRKHLRYLVHRISYEQNLLDAYSSEGWRGQSLEKLRPEKELQRAKADINRSKVKIRELFHRLDSLSTEGKFPDALYDSDGLIDSEDIFCAKCGSKDLLAGNDIILCDGNCDRGFHQYCLEPPLRTEEIPPGDEGWFCPACDCKFDCIDLLNDSQGAKLSIEDSWEKVFPEAVAAMVGLKQDDIMGLPSDDSDDNDYNPDGQDGGYKDEEKESGSSGSDSDESDESDFSSASEDLGAVCKNEQDLGLPSDDPEDDDFNPDVANANDDDDDEHASSSSDFTSASENLATVGSDDDNGDSLPVEPDQKLDDPSPISARRHIERLDYKKLYDETYGNGGSDSSDGDEWTDDVGTKRSKISTKREVSVAANIDALTSVDGSDPVVAPQRRGRAKRDRRAENCSTVKVQNPPQESSAGGTSKKRPPYNKLPESVTQRLYESFKENQYPDRSTKEKLAGELGLTLHKVDKWFGNARWSFNHHPSRVEACIARVLPGGSTPKKVESSSSKFDKETEETISTPRTTRKRKEDAELQTSKIDTANEKDPEKTISTPRTNRKRKEDNEVQASKIDTAKEKETGEMVSTPRTTRKRKEDNEVQTSKMDTTKEEETGETISTTRTTRKRKEDNVGQTSKIDTAKEKETGETISTTRTTRKRKEDAELQTSETQTDPSETNKDGGRVQRKRRKSNAERG